MPTRCRNKPVLIFVCQTNLLEQYLVRLDVTVVHDQVLGEEVLERDAIDDIELTIPFEPIHHVVNTLLKLIPILLVNLHLRLSYAQIFVEFLQIIMVVNLIELVLLSDFREQTDSLHAKLTRFFRELLLQLKQVPVLSHTTEHMVEEVIKVLAEGIPNKNNMISESDLMLRQVACYLVLHYALS